MTSCSYSPHFGPEPVLTRRWPRRSCARARTWTSRRLRQWVRTVTTVMSWQSSQRCLPGACCFGIIGGSAGLWTSTTSPPEKCIKKQHAAGRTAHCNGPGSQAAAAGQDEGVLLRATVYVAMAPRATASPAALVQRRASFLKHKDLGLHATGHTYLQSVDDPQVRRTLFAPAPSKHEA